MDRLTNRLPVRRVQRARGVDVPPGEPWPLSIPAVQQLLQQSGVGLADIAVIESNEAFAAQAMAVNRTLGLDPARVNPNGGAIALGHPVGATGAILVVKALYELERLDAQFALITLCIGGGQGIALLLERCG